MSTKSFTALVLGMVSMVLVTAGCGKNPTAPQSTLDIRVATTSAVGAQSVQAAALPTTGVAYYTPEQMIANFKKVEITQDGSSWVTLWEGSSQFDVAGGQVVNPLGGAVPVPEGEYHGIRFTIGDNLQGFVHVDSVLYAGVLSNYEGTYSFGTPNGTLTQPFVIQGGGPHSVVFTFNVTSILGYDPSKISPNGTHWFLVKPPCTVDVK